MTASRSDRVRSRAGELGYAAGWRLVRALPEPVATLAFTLGADVAARRGDHLQLRRNLGRVLGVAPGEVPQTVVRDALRSYARYWQEAFRLPSADHEDIRARVRIEGDENIQAGLDAGRGVLLVLPHTGNWDVAGLWLVGRTGTFTTVAERLRPESLYRRFVAYRENLGFEILPLTGGESPVRGIVRRLRAGGVVCLVGDRDLSRAGIPVTFFGEAARMPAGPASIARSTGAALLPVDCVFTGAGWRLRVHPPVDPTLDVAAATQVVADRFAASIAAHPADWHMLQPFWVADLPARWQAELGGAG
ncbi:phosphatidylinositol mannoside acyltransferase [Rhodococcus antarcticus]|uniref:Phosphatidylinositol mannoside acyltransferase n=1 Tax=Rhodococcus antarcticus TaxID=2987751 RepID=A0ABY6P368_9NOCA|nr:phosphatidylinositol mannoside acyltransferase [Rhodococcus antarcticus]UZJ26092.1 phosphatidylinositol mannoside acyltransferase [Rhodococcus antarcticus]